GTGFCTRLRHPTASVNEGQSTEISWLSLAGSHRNSALEHIGLKKSNQSYHRCPRDGMPPDFAEDRPQGMRPLVGIIVTGGARDHDGLGVDHLAHYAARRVGSHDQGLIQVELLGGDALQAAEESVRSRV